MPKGTRRGERGSALITAMVMLTVLTIVGVAAVSLSTQEQGNAAAKTRVDFVQACANAAQAKIWAEMSQAGLGYLTSNVTITPMGLPGSVTLVPGHYDSEASTITVSQVTFGGASSAANVNAQSGVDQDCTNRLCGLTNSSGGTRGIFVHCKDAKGREFEMEMAVQLAF